MICFPFYVFLQWVCFLCFDIVVVVILLFLKNIYFGDDSKFLYGYAFKRLMEIFKSIFYFEIMQIIYRITLN